MSATLRMPTWDQLAGARPDMVATMRAYLTQIGCVLRPGSVMGADQACGRWPRSCSPNIPRLSGWLRSTDHK